jgi:hypothetical protein
MWGELAEVADVAEFWIISADGNDLVILLSLLTWLSSYFYW